MIDSLEGVTHKYGLEMEEFVMALQKDLVAPDPVGPPLLYMQGLADVIMPPASEAACRKRPLS